MRAAVGGRFNAALQIGELLAEAAKTYGGDLPGALEIYQGEPIQFPVHKAVWKDEGSFWRVTGSGIIRDELWAFYAQDQIQGFSGLEFEALLSKSRVLESKVWPEWRPVFSEINGYYYNPYVIPPDQDGPLLRPSLAPLSVTGAKVKAKRKRVFSVDLPRAKRHPATAGGMSIILPPKGPPRIRNHVPKGRKRGERKHRGHQVAFAVLGAALDWGSESAEYFEIIRELAGVDPNFSQREAFLDLYRGKIWDIDPGEFALAIAQNVILDAIVGRVMGWGGRKMRKAGFTHQQLALWHS